MHGSDAQHAVDGYGSHADAAAGAGGGAALDAGVVPPSDEPPHPITIAESEKKRRRKDRMMAPRISNRCTKAPHTIFTRSRERG